MDKKITSIHITKALSSSMIVDLIDEYPDLEEITCAPSVYDRTSQTYIDALKEVGINVKIKFEWGAKSKSNDIEFYIAKLYKEEGLNVKQISLKLGIPSNRVYYLLRKSKTKIKRRKHKHDYSEVKQLKKDGYSAKEISEELDMPIRTVYYILNKDKIKNELPIAPITRILKNAGAQRSSKDAKIELATILTKEGNEIAKKAIDLAHADGKKTIKVEHIKLAKKLLCQ